MKAKLRHFMSALAVLAIALSSCSKSKVYEQVIPDDADFVIAISVNQLVKKSEILSSENKALREVFFSDSNEKMSKVFKPIIEDPKKSGLDFSSPIYFFQTPDFEAGILARVSDQGKLRDFIKQIIELGENKPQMVEKDGITLIVDDKGSENSACAFSKDALLILSRIDSSSKDVRAELTRLINLKEGKRYYQRAAFKELKSKDADIACILEYSRLQRLASDYATPMFPLQKGLTDIQTVMHFTFEKGRMVGNFKYTSENKDALKKYQELYKSLMPQKTKNVFEKYLPKNNFFILNGFIDGTKASSFYKDSPEFTPYLEALSEMGLDPNQLSSLFDGEVAFTVNSFMPVGGKIGMVLYSQGKTPTVVDQIASAIRSYTNRTDSLERLANKGDVDGEFYYYSDRIALETQGEHQYMAKKRNDPELYFGHKDGVNYLAVGTEGKDILFKEQAPSVKDAAYASILKGHSMAMAVDFNYIFTGSPIGGMIGAFLPPKIFEKIKTFSYLSMSGNGEEGQMELKLTTKDNPLKLITDISRLLATNEK